MNENKFCSVCKSNKNKLEFARNPSNGDGLNWCCKPCQAQYMKEYYKRNNSKHKKATDKVRRNRREILQDYLFNYLTNHPCVDCGQSNIITLEFDHVRGVKCKSIANLLSSAASIDNLKSEIEKCEVRCANCHRRKTSKDFGNYRLKQHQ